MNFRPLTGPRARSADVSGASAADLDIAAVASWVAVGVVAAASVVLRLLGVDWSRAATFLVAGGLLVGLPHGAVDHLAPRWRHAQRAMPVVALVACYAALALVAWSLLRAWPLVGLGVLLALSVVHFGLGEATFHGLRQKTGLPSCGAGLGIALVVIFLPLLIHAPEAAPYLHAMAPSWDGRLGPTWESALTLLVLAVALLTGLTALLRGRGLVAGEMLLLVVLALAAPPAVTVATYFGWWHSVRHTAVLLTEERALSGPHAMRSLAQRAAVPTAVAALALVGLWLWSGGNALNFVSEQIWLLAALTVPHALVVAWLDRTRDQPHLAR